MLGYRSFFRGQQHHHLPPLESWKLLDNAMRLQIAANPLEQAYAELLVRHFAAAKPQRHLGLVAFAEKPDQIPQLDLVITFIGSGPELDFLDLDLLELEPRFVCSLGLAVLELPEVHDPAYGRLRQRSNLHQIEFCGLRPRDRVCDRHDAKLFTFHTYQAYLRRIDLAVDSLCFVLGYWQFSKK